MSLRAPYTIISDNGTNFASKQVANFCAKYKTAHQLFSPYYPQGNGQAEISNRTISTACAKAWAELRAMGQETLQSAIGLKDHQASPDGQNIILIGIWDEAIITVDISRQTLCVKGVDRDQNDAQPSLILDQSEEKQQQAQIRIAAY